MRLSRQHLVAAAFVVAPVVGLALAGVAVLARQQARQRAADLVAAVAEARAELADTPVPVAAAAPAHPSLLADQPDLVGTLRELESLAAATHGGLTEAEPQPARTPGKQTFRLQGRAALTDVCAFLAAIENSKRLMILGPGKVEAATGVEVHYDFECATYHREEGGR